MEHENSKTKGMKPTKEQLLRDPNTHPTKEVLSEILGQAYAAYVQFVSRLARHEVQLEWRYYTDGKAWLGKGIHKWVGARGGQKEATVFWLSIWDGFFKVTVYIPEKARASLLSLPVDVEVQQMAEDSSQMGKLKFFPLTFEMHSDERLETIFTIVDFKKGLK